MLIVAGPVGASGHEGGTFHPEQPSRLAAVMAGIDDLRLGTDLVTVQAELVPAAELTRVHAPDYLQHLEQFCMRGGGQLDPDTFAGTDSWEVARLSAGAGLSALRELQRVGDGVGFVASRPPGHHAESGEAKGFCLLNNVAITASSLTAAGHRVLIVDWDVHHGNGTQSLFWDDPNVLYVSTHQWPLYPGTGRASETGGPAAPGLVVNIPLPAGATGDVVRHAFEGVAGPVVEDFRPDWVLVSCGFDAHRSDPLGGLSLSASDFGALALVCRSFAPASGRMLLFLEGGYNPISLRASVKATLGALLGDPGGPGSEHLTHGGPGLVQVDEAVIVRRRALEGVD